MRPLACLLFSLSAPAIRPIWAAGAESAGHGLSAGALMRWLGAAIAVFCLVSLAACALFRRRLSRETYHRYLFGVFLLLPVVFFATLGSVLEETKSVQSCASCHVMESFVKDLTDPKSETLASAHFRNKWIPENQCYSCHTSYGVHGTLEAKLGGLRHWALYVTGSWKEPIRYRGKYPNSNCLACHGGTPKYEAVKTHVKNAAALLADTKSCASCHTPHPEPPAAPGASPSPTASPSPAGSPGGSATP